MACGYFSCKLVVSRHLFNCPWQLVDLLRSGFFLSNCRYLTEAPQRDVHLQGGFRHSMD